MTIPMKRSLAIALLVTGCSVSTTSPATLSPAPTSAAPTVASAAPSAAVPTPSSRLSATPIDATLVLRFEAAVARLETTLASLVEPDMRDWPAAQAHFTKQADAYQVFSQDLEAITFPDTVVLNGETKDLGRDSAALIGWSKEIAVVARQIAAAASADAAAQEMVEFGGSSYPIAAFIQDATGEWWASLGLTSDDLGLDRGGSAPPSSPPP